MDIVADAGFVLDSLSEKDIVGEPDIVFDAAPLAVLFA
jgi:hypothetical protein